MASPTISPQSHPDAITLLSTDHTEVKRLFAAYDNLIDRAGTGDQREGIALRICAMLTAHATLEEEIFYPAARQAIDEDDLLDEATVEHAVAKDLIAQIERMSPSDDLYNATVKVLGEYIDHHVREEEGELFPIVRESDIDLEQLGAALKARKAELMAPQLSNA
jgi:hemerythrin superfamily protein